MKPGDGIALLAVEMSSRDGSLSPDVRKEMAYLVRRLLQQCLRPDTDALLPKMDLTSVREIFFLVACTQKHGPDVIGKRIRTQFQRSEQLRPSDLTFSISHTFLTPISREMNESMETFSERVVAGIQDSINTISLKRSV